jgi:hypothetical protein
MQNRVSDYIRSNMLGLVAIFIALSGTAYALDGPLPGQNQVGSDDIINGEVKNGDLGTDAVASGKIADRQVKNADLALGASSSNTIADGGIQGIDVKSNTLTGTQVDESTLFNDNSLGGDDINESTLYNDDSLTGDDINESSLSGLIRGSGEIFGRPRAVPAGFYANVIGPFVGDGTPFTLSYHCPSSPASQNGAWRFLNETGDSINLFADNGSSSPSFAGEVAGDADHFEAAYFGGEYIVLSAQYPNGTIATIDAFSRHRATDCHAQAQAVLTVP